MKVALVLSRPPGYSETFFRSKISGLVKNGIQVELYVDHRDPEFTLCPQFSLPENKLRYVVPVLTRILFKHPKRLMHFCRVTLKSNRSFSEFSKRLYNCLHLLQASSVDWIHFGFATMAIGREQVPGVLGAKLAVSFRGYDITRYPLRHPGCYNQLWKHVDRIHVISDSLLQNAKKLGLPQNVAWKRITPAVDTNLFSESTITEPVHDPVRLLTIARLHWVKGFDYTFEALAYLKKQGQQFIYTIIGEGAELDRLILAADQFGILKNIRFMGKIPHAELVSYYRQTDIYLQYSVQEGFCNSVLEAQSAGVLCIVSDAGGLPENISNGETGWVVPRRQPRLLADKIIEVINSDENTRQSIRVNAMKHVRNDFNLEKQNNEFAEFYNSYI